MSFDTVLDSGLFHALSEQERPFFLHGLRATVRLGGYYHFLGFSEREPGTVGPRRLSEQEIRQSFVQGFKLQRLERVRFETNIHPEGAQAWLGSLERVSDEG